MTDWLERYLDGREAEVWHEFRQRGATIRGSDDEPDARAVCDEMARRARHNVEVLVERLTASDYRFHDNDDEESPVVPHVPPTPTAAADLAWADDHAGPIPMTVAAWIRHVGDVWLVGTHPAWADSSAADPLVVEFEFTRYRGDSLRLAVEHAPRNGGLLELHFAPDRLHKADISGGLPYAVVLPDGCVDGVVVGETATTSFVEHVRNAFRNGGFPWSTDDPAAYRVRSELAEGLLPL